MLSPPVAMADSFHPNSVAVLGAVLCACVCVRVCGDGAVLCQAAPSAVFVPFGVPNPSNPCSYCGVLVVFFVQFCREKMEDWFSFLVQFFFVAAAAVA